MYIGGKYNIFGEISVFCGEISLLEGGHLLQTMQ